MVPEEVIDPTLLALPTNAAASSSKVKLDDPVNDRQSTDFTTEVDTSAEDEHFEGGFLAAINRKLALPRNEADLSAIFTLLSTTPSDDTVLQAYRVGFGPVNGCCRFCGRDIDEIVNSSNQDELRKHRKKGRPRLETKAKKTKQKVLYKKEVSCFALHAQSCSARQVLDKHIDELLARYPATVSHCILRDQPYFKKATNHVVRLRSLSSITNPGKCGNRGYLDNPYLKCASCPDVELRNPHAAYDHLIVHGVFVPLIRDITPQLNEDCRAGKWTREIANFPEPVFHDYDNEFHWDPLDNYRVCEKIMRKYSDMSAAQTAYGRDASLVYPKGALQEDDNGKSPDTKYDSILGPYARCDKQGHCLLCINDPGQSPNRAAKPYNANVNFSTHTWMCFRIHAKKITELEQLVAAGLPVPLRHDYLWDSGRLICPDPTCVRNHRTFGTLLELAWHLVAVHFFRIRGRRGRTHDKPHLTDLSFTDADQLATALDTGTLPNGKDDEDEDEAQQEGGSDAGERTVTEEVTGKGKAKGSSSRNGRAAKKARVSNESS
jgi:hypothetical protein